MNRQQIRTFWGCIIVYTLLFVGRLNFAASVSSLFSALRIDIAQMGFVSSLFSVVYAFGQLANGMLSQWLNPKVHISIGLLGSALCNFLLGCSNAYWQIMLCWGVNGLFQSMVWTPIMCIVSTNFEGRSQHIISFSLALTMVAGHFLAWAISGYFANLSNWRLSYLIPAAILTAAALIGKALFKDAQTHPSRSPRGQARFPVKAIAVSSGLPCILVSCIVLGFVRDGIMNWGPAILNQQGGIGLESTTLSLIVPAINLIGILFSQYAVQKNKGNVLGIISVMMLSASLISFALWRTCGCTAIVTAVLLGSECALMYGCTTLHTIAYPLYFKRIGAVGFVAGMIDATIYLGAAMGNTVASYMASTENLPLLYTIWIGCLLLAAAAAGFAKGKVRKWIAPAGDVSSDA